MREITILLEDENDVISITRSIGPTMGELYESFKNAALAFGFAPETVEEYFQEYGV